MLHISVQGAPPAAATAQATARRVIGGVRVQYMPSGLAARRLQMSPRSLGKLTGDAQAHNRTPLFEGTETHSVYSRPPISHASWHG